MLLETTRECLRDVFDVPALREVMGDLRSRRTKLVAVETEHASPFAQSLLFRWIAVFMYEGDAPLAERRAAALALDRDLLRELLGAEELRDLLDPTRDRRGRARAAATRRRTPRARCRRRARPAARPRAARRRRGRRTRQTATPTRGCTRCSTTGARSVVRVAGEERLAAVEDAARLRDALGVSLPRGLPGRRSPARPIGRCATSSRATRARTVRSCRPTSRHASASRVDRVEAALDGARDATARSSTAASRPAGVEHEWCDADVLRRLRQRSLAALRREVEPVEAAAFARFLPAWQGADRPNGASDALVDAIGHLQGAAIPASILETDVLPARVRAYRPADLDALAASGDLVWVGAGGLGADDGRVVLCFRGQARSLLREPSRRASDPTAPSTMRSARTSLGVVRRSGPTSCRRPAPPTSVCS